MPTPQGYVDQRLAAGRAPKSVSRARLVTSRGVVEIRP